MKEPRSKTAVMICYLISIPSMITGFCIGFTTGNDTLQMVMWLLMMAGCVMFYIAVKSTIWLIKQENREKCSKSENIDMGRKTSISEEKLRAIRESFQEIHTPDIDYCPNNDKTNHDTPCGSIAAGREIADKLIEKLKTDNGIPFKKLFAYLGAMAGRECSEGLIQSLKKLVPDSMLRENIAGVLDMMIVRTTSDELFLMGDQVGNTFFDFYKKALKEPELKVDALLPLARETAGIVGSEQYWRTKYDNQVNVDFKDMVNTAQEEEFAELLRKYCSYPSERLTAYAYATKIALSKLEMTENSDINGDPRAIAVDILADYGWRASHYIWNWD